MCRFYIAIQFAVMESCKIPAGVISGSFRPVMIIDDLDLQIQSRVVVQAYVHIQDDSFLLVIFTKDDGICNLYIFDALRRKVQKGCTKPREGKLVGLKSGFEQIIIGHSDPDRAGGILELKIRFKRLM